MGLNAQVRSQTSEQDEASFERRRRQLLGESWGMPPPPPHKILKSRGSETFPQYIHLILAGFILTNPIFSRNYFLN